MTRGRRAQLGGVARVTVAVAALTTGVAGLLAGTETSSTAQVATSGAVAAADGVSVTMEAVSGPVSDRPVDTGLPTAQAAIDPQGTSAAYAAVPHPGETVLNGPGLVGGATGGPVPGYPFFVEAAYPVKPEDHADFGAATLDAKASETDASATATTGIGAGDGATGRSQSRAGAVAHDGGVTATAEAVTEAVTIAEVLRIGRVRSFAQAARSESGEVTKRAEIEIEGVTVAGQAVRVTPNGVEAGGSALGELPGNPVSEVLKSQGLTVRYIEGSETEEGVVAPALEVSMLVPFPGLSQPAKVTYRFGYVSAMASGVNLSGFTFSDPTNGASGFDTPATGGFETPALDTALPSASVPSASNDGDASTGPSPRASGDVVASRPLGAASGLLPADFAIGFYLVLVVGGFVALGGAQVFRFLGVRVAWR